MGKPHVRDVRTLFNQEGLTPKVISLFQGCIWQYYLEHGRTFPWRETDDPYRILVSEVMLQQTQVSRVVNKYNEFISTFPNFFKLAKAPLREVLRVWQGLGYNRRALALQRMAKEVITEFDGQLPSDPEVLQRFPSIGPYTAAAVAAIAFNKPTVFIETNIRTIFLYFFAKSDQTSDRDILPLVEATLDRANPREWYYALFDYGAMLKHQRKDIPRPKQHRQDCFKGSNREMRGHIIRLLLSQESITEQKLIDLLNGNSERVRQITVQLQEEGLIDIWGDQIQIR
jgi:A/G-specific adenine glycosylase